MEDSFDTWRIRSIRGGDEFEFIAKNGLKRRLNVEI